MSVQYANDNPDKATLPKAIILIFADWLINTPAKVIIRIVRGTATQLAILMIATCSDESVESDEMSDIYEYTS